MDGRQRQSGTTRPWFSAVGTAVVLALLALLVRAVQFGPDQFRNGPTFFAEPGDEAQYIALAINLRRGHGYTDLPLEAPATYANGVYTQVALPPGPRKYQRPPVYPLLIATVYGVAGEHAAGVRVLQWLLEGLIAALVFLLGMALGGRHARAVGVVAALGWIGLTGLGHIPVFSHRLITETVFTLVCLLVTLAVLATSRAERRAWLPAAGAGVAIGLMLLTRGSAVLVPPMLAAVVLWRARTAWRGRLLRVTIMAGIAVIVVLPWVIVASTERGQFVLSSSNGGQTFVDGNNPGALAGRSHSLARIQPDDWDFPPGAPESVQEYEFRSRHGYEWGGRWLTANSDRIPQLVFNRLKVGIGHHGVLWGLAVAGLIALSLPRLRGLHGGPDGWILAAWPISFLVISAVFFGELRYMTPYHPMMLVLAATAPVVCAARVCRRGVPETTVPPGDNPDGDGDHTAR